MPEIKEQIDLLVLLQEKDLVIDGIKKQLENNPTAMEALKNNSAQFHAEFENEKKAFLDMQKLRKEKELELLTKEGEIKKHNLELNSIKSNDAYKALLNEIQNAKFDISRFEDEIIGLMEQIDQESGKIKIAENEMKKKEQENQSKIAAIESETAKLKGELERLQKERDEFAKTIPSDLLGRYDYIRESRDGTAIVGIEGNTCGGCATVLRPQTINEVFKGKDLVSCDNCQRIIYKKHGT